MIGATINDAMLNATNGYNLKAIGSCDSATNRSYAIWSRRLKPSSEPFPLKGGRAGMGVFAPTFPEAR